MGNYVRGLERQSDDEALGDSSVTMATMATMRDLAKAARVASRTLGTSTRTEKDRALAAIARALGTPETRARILAANARDLEAAQARGTRGALLDRLALDDARVESMARAVLQIAGLADPVGETIADAVRPSGIRVRRVRVPIGVIAMIYEARPNVTVEASALCLKAGNAVILRGGSEAMHSNVALAAVIGDALEESGLPGGRDAIALVSLTGHEAIRALLQQTESIDLAIPRGGEALIRFVSECSRVPVIQHFKGVCHLFVDRGADVAMAVALATNSKLQRPGVCNAVECLLVDRKDAPRVLPRIAEALLEGGCELRVCPESLALLRGGGGEASEASETSLRLATDADWGFEFLDKIVAVRLVDEIDGALAHVARYGSGHTEAICTTSEAHAERWRREADCACAVVNASTRFHDGGELGLGAEIGIATSRLHWRGAMGLESLTTMKWLVDGQGQVRG